MGSLVLGFETSILAADLCSPFCVATLADWPFSGSFLAADSHWCRLAWLLNIYRSFVACWAALWPLYEGALSFRRLEFAIALPDHG